MEEDVRIPTPADFVPIEDLHPKYECIGCGGLLFEGDHTHCPRHRPISSYHKTLGAGVLPNGYYAHGEFGNEERGTYIHYLLIFHLRERAHILYHLVDGVWVRQYRITRNVAKDLEEYRDVAWTE